MVIGKLSTAAFTRFNIIYTPKIVPSKSVLPTFVESKNVCPTFVEINEALSSPEILASPFR